MHLPIVLSDPDTVKPDAFKAYTRVLNRMKDMDMEITGMNHEFFLAGEELRQGTMKCMLVTCPKAACICRNVDANSDTIQLFGGTGREGGKFLRPRG